MEKNILKLTECPRDALQGLSYIVPTVVKTEYYNLLLKAGFDVLDFGSFVSPKAIPQMADTMQVLENLDLAGTKTKLLAIVANKQGVDTAVNCPGITYLGFPLSVSENFQQRNTRSGIKEGLELIKYTLEISNKSGKELVVYLSMAFGNPYQEAWSTHMVCDYAALLASLGCKIISLADTVGLATEKQVSDLGKAVSAQLPSVEIGMHLHTVYAEANAKIEAAVNSGCHRLDTALGGLGGCPFAEDELTGNMPTESVLSYFQNHGIHTGLDMKMLDLAKQYLNKHIIK